MELRGIDIKIITRRITEKLHRGSQSINSVVLCETTSVYLCVTIKPTK
jgi:hypothetical protein